MADAREVQEKIKSEKVAKLKKYEKHIRERMSGDVPPKHQKTESVFKAWLDRELKRTLNSLAALGS